MEILQEIGLTKAESKVYLALLELGSSTTGPLIEASEVASSKIYGILDKLIQKGLVGFVIKSGTKYFEAAEPVRLLDYLQDKKEKIQEQETHIRTLLPQLEIKKKMSLHKAQTTTFKGIEGVRSAYEDVLKTMTKGESYDVLVGMKPKEPLLSFITQYHRRRSKAGINVRILYSPDSLEFANGIKKMPHTSLKVAPQQLISSAFIVIYKDKTMITVMEGKDLTVFRLEGKQAAESFRTTFKHLWDQEVHTLTTLKEIGEAFLWITAEMKEKESMVYGARRDVRLAEILKEHHRRRAEKGIATRMICTAESRTKMNDLLVPSAHCQLKFHTPDFNPLFEVGIYGDSVLMVSWGKKPLGFIINNKDVAESHRKYFEFLWEQEVTATKGMDNAYATWNTMLDELQPGEEYYVMGASWAGQSREMPPFFKEFHRRRIAKGVKAKFLFVAGAEQAKGELNEYYTVLGQVKFLPEHVYEGIQFNLYHEKLLMFVWRENEPVIFTIEDKNTYKTFKTYFDSLWVQDTKIRKGIDAIQDVFEEMLAAGHCDYIGARGYFIDLRREWVENDWLPRAKKQGFTMRNIVDKGVKGHVITTFPFAQTKYTLPPEFAELSVFWIFGEKVVISNWSGEEPIVISIDNKQLHDVYTKQFEVLWKKK